MVTNDPEAVASADRVVLPGVGAFADCRRGLDAVDGMVAALEEAVRTRAARSSAFASACNCSPNAAANIEVTEGLGWIAGEVDRITPADRSRIPHMGWNTLRRHAPAQAGRGTIAGSEGLHAYFVHSYELKVAQRADLVAEADYGGPLTAIVAHDNIVGTQFHPEKSQKLGLAVIAIFSVEAVILFPAIDLKNGEAVRLEQGDMARATVFHRDPAEQARAFAAQGFAYLHIVDLDGAFAGRPSMRRRSSVFSPRCDSGQVGGGIRDHATMEGWLGKGVARVIIGTAAVRDPALVKEAAKKFPTASRSDWTRATAKSRSRAGRKAPSFRRRRSPGVSRTPALPPSSTPTSRATACSRGSISTRPSRSPTRSPSPSSLRAVLPRLTTCAPCSRRGRKSLRALSSGARSMTDGSMRRRRCSSIGAVKVA